MGGLPLCLGLAVVLLCRMMGRGRRNVGKSVHC